ncbi:hypothetical protein BKH41_03045 [Helicobacter sp. 12S02232-10]|uniref:hypothetical protein n=1 Tax=Helicobacter sp. 12S02232-10 TaxID=1476197 RepID=UPI000BA4F096|nr:hypothetical protein [Helicobacter sp. 12S02232-10]PAF49081.1 hypothetical protein BKH41_03045 [Helicobacter sp. 12S02232-10]
MKITPRNPSPINDTIVSKKSSEVVSEKKPNEVKNSQDSIKIDESDLSKSTKEINNAIGALQTAILSIDEMSEEGKSLLKISKKLQNQEKEDKQESIDKADKIKEKITKTFDSSDFNGQNVFIKNYRRLDLDVKFDASTIKPSQIKADSPETSESFLKNLNIQKKYAKNAIHLLNQKLETNLESFKKTNSDYDTLDKSALNEKQFKESHKTDGITLERLAKLLG